MGTSVKEYRNKQDKLIKDSGAYFYYLRGENRHIFGGVCLKKVDNVWCRGISICSNRDKFDKDMAKKYARSRLLTAIHTKGDSLPVNPDASESSNKLYRYYTGLFYNYLAHITAHKSKYGAILTDTEKRTVGE
jgi:hypothetical protein